jgi:hypothetical protein
VKLKNDIEVFNKQSLAAVGPREAHEVGSLGQVLCELDFVSLVLAKAREI